AGLPQVVSPQALAGTAPGVPALVARTKEGLVAAVHSLLAEPRRRVQLATEAHAHVATEYSVERWAPVVSSLVGPGGGGPAIARDNQDSEATITSARRSPLNA